MNDKQTATVFFLPLEDRPKDLPPLKDFKGKFWHTGIFFENKIYECFNFSKWSVSGIEKLKKHEFKNAIYIEHEVNKEKLMNELKSGIDCAEYVARSIGLSDLTGCNKGSFWPEDIYNHLTQKQNFL